MSLDPPRDSHTVSTTAILGPAQTTTRPQKLSISCACCTHQHRILSFGSTVAITLTVTVSPLKARPCSTTLTSHTVPAPDLSPKAARSVYTFRPRLLSVGVVVSILPLLWAWSDSQADIPAPNHGLPFFFLFFLVYIFPPSNLFWPGLASDRQPALSQLLLSPTGCNHFPVTPIHMRTSTS